MIGVRSTTRHEKESFWSKLLQNFFLKRKLFWLITLVILASDLWTKDLFITMVSEKGDGQYLWVTHPWFALVDVSNKGGPWGLGRETPEILRLIRIAALGVILYILMSTPYRNRAQIISLALVMGGALGNIWDSWVYGSVRDFLYFDLGFPPANPWPAFNLADSMICVGVFGLALSMLLNNFALKQSEKKVPDNSHVP